VSHQTWSKSICRIWSGQRVSIPWYGLNFKLSKIRWHTPHLKGLTLTNTTQEVGVLSSGAKQPECINNNQPIPIMLEETQCTVVRIKQDKWWSGEQKKNRCERNMDERHDTLIIFDASSAIYNNVHKITTKCISLKNYSGYTDIQVTCEVHKMSALILYMEANHSTSVSDSW
jgi:hypothetical protein